MKIYYGIKENNVDVTDICIEKLTHNNIVNIHCGDNNRAFYFTDHIVGIHKFIIIDNEEYDENLELYINLLDNTVNFLNFKDKISNIRFFL